MSWYLAGSSSRTARTRSAALRPANGAGATRVGDDQRVIHRRAEHGGDVREDDLSVRRREIRQRPEPALDGRRLDVVQVLLAEDRERVQPESKLDCHVRALLKGLRGEPLPGVGLEQDLARVRIDVLTPHEVG